MPRSLRIGFGLLVVAPMAAVAQAPPPDDTVAFKLGTIEVSAPAVDRAALGSSVSGRLLRLLDRNDLAQAINLLPGVSVSNVGPRNEAQLYLRGFDLRQTPLLIDGIPVYVPYDGYVDLRRFTTFDAAGIQIAPGFSSALIGPNTLGGAINVVSRRPTERGELSGGVGAFSEGGYQAYLNAGTRQGRWYGLLSGSYLTQDGFRLADGFSPVPVQGPGQRSNAYRTDYRISGKLAFTPNATDEYALGYVNQKGEKGNPPYAGTDPSQAVRYWRWPQWDKQSVYALTSTAVGRNATVKLRGYYDKFLNQLFAFDDSSYTTQTRGSSFQSYYDDDTFGGSAEASLSVGPGVTIRSAAHAKVDAHREHNLGEPVRTTRDRTASVGVEATVDASSDLTVIAGISYDDRRGLRAEELVNGQVEAMPVTTSHNLNPQVAALYRVGPGTLRASVARKSRFPTFKDRYSYRLGTAIPNPGLRAEGATHLELGYGGELGSGLSIRASVFYSRIDDLIQRVDDVARDPQDRPLFQLQNVGDARHQGFELSGDYRAGSTVELGAAFSFLDRDNLTRPEIRLIDTPRGKLTGYLSYTPVHWLSAVTSAEWNDSRFTTAAGATTEAFTVVNLKGAVRPTRVLSAEVGVMNVFDEAYELFGGFPEPGRTVFVNLTFALGRGGR